MKGTLFGILSTIVYFLSFITITVYYITQTLLRKNYVFSISTMKHEDITSIKLDKEIFALNFALEDPANYSEYKGDYRFKRSSDASFFIVL